MDLTAPIDIYCERLDPGLWAEPLNALSNLAFLAGALWAGLRLRGQPFVIPWALVACLTAIGIGSGLFHTFATGWALLSDVIPILAFVLVTLFGTARTLLGWSLRSSLLAVALFFPYAMIGGWLAGQIPVLAISASYWPIAALIFAATAYLWRSHPVFARGLGLAGLLLLASLTARSLDMALCPDLPHGTHFLWHLLNGTLLALVIDAFRRQMLAGARGRG